MAPLRHKKGYAVQQITFSLSGKSKLRAWKPGYIQPALILGFNLREAQTLAKLHDGLVDEQIVHNLVVNTGKYFVADHLLDNETVGLTYHAIGTDATNPTLFDTSLGAEATRKIFSLRERVANIITLSVFYLASECPYNIKEVGIFGGSTATATLGSGTLFSHFLQSKDNTGGIVDLTFDYELEVKGN